MLQWARSSMQRRDGRGQCAATSEFSALTQALCRRTVRSRIMASGQGEQKQVTLRLTTRMPAPFRVPPHPLAVPARLTRFGLSEVVNSLLKLGASLRVDGGARTTGRRPD